MLVDATVNINTVQLHLVNTHASVTDITIDKHE